MKDPEKMSRQEVLQQDRIQKTLYRFVNHLHKKQKQYWLVAFLSIIFILCFWGTLEYQKAEKKTRANLFYIASKTLGKYDLSNAERRVQSIVGLKDFLHLEKDSSLGSVAKLYLGRLFYETERIEDAQSAFQSVLNHPSSNELMKNVANISLIALYEYQKNWQGVKETLSKLNDKQWDDLRWYTEAKMLREQGHFQEAEKYLKDLVNQFPNSIYRESAEIQLLLN